MPIFTSVFVIKTKNDSKRIYAMQRKTDIKVTTQFLIEKSFFQLNSNQKNKLICKGFPKPLFICKGFQ